MKAAVMGVVQAHFRPEFINRLDDIVVFHPLASSRSSRSRASSCAASRSAWASAASASS
jgi:hypothetical protein